MKKSKRYVRICAALLCAVLCLSVNVAPAMAAKVTQADIDALKGNAASLDKKQKEIQSKLNGLKDDKAAAVQKKTLLDDQIANTNAKISNTEAQISDYNALISQAETELADAQQREEAQYELFCKRVREMEERGTISYWSVARQLARCTAPLMSAGTRLRRWKPPKQNWRPRKSSSAPSGTRPTSWSRRSTTTPPSIRPR